MQIKNFNQHISVPLLKHRYDISIIKMSQTHKKALFAFKYIFCYGLSIYGFGVEWIFVHFIFGNLALSRSFLEAFFIFSSSSPWEHKMWEAKRKLLLQSSMLSTSDENAFSLLSFMCLVAPFDLKMWNESLTNNWNFLALKIEKQKIWLVCATGRFMKQSLIQWVNESMNRWRLRDIYNQV